VDIYPIQKLCEGRGRRLLPNQIVPALRREFARSIERASRLFPAISTHLQGVELKISRLTEEEGISAEYDWTLDTVVAYLQASGGYQCAMELRGLIAHEVGHAVVHHLFNSFYGKSRYSWLDSTRLDDTDETLADIIAISLLPASDQMRLFRRQGIDS
jgi:hypothetical protein